jgi:HEAT repeat protein
MPLIISFMGDQDSGIRLKAKEIAIRVSPAKASAKLIELLDVVEVKCDAIKFLREIDPFPVDAFPVLLRLIQAGGFEDKDPESDDVHFIEECIFALAEHASDKIEMIEPLTALLSSNQPGIRHAAAWGLGEFGLNAASAVEALAGALADESPDVRYNAALSLGKIGTGATPALPKMQKTAANEKNSEVRRILQEAIQKIFTAEAGLTEPVDAEE